jgi:hypothetical protein
VAAVSIHVDEACDAVGGRAEGVAAVAFRCGVIQHNYWFVCRHLDFLISSVEDGG